MAPNLQAAGNHFAFHFLLRNFRSKFRSFDLSLIDGRVSVALVGVSPWQVAL